MPHFETTITGDGDLVLSNGGGVTGGHCRVEGGFYAGTSVDTNYDLFIKGAAKIESISNATSDTNKFLVSDGGEIKYRTGAEVLSDIGAGTGTVTGSGTATRVAFWSSSSALSSNSDLYWDNTNDRLGIGTASPSSTLHVVKNQDINADANSRGVLIDYNLSGTTAQTSDHYYEGLFIDADSSATGGDTTNEVRFSGIRCMVEDSGDANDLYGGYFDARNDKTVANDTVANVFGTYSIAYGRHTAGEVKNIVGVQAYAYTDNASSGTNVASLAGGKFFALQSGDSGKTVNNAYGVYGKVDLAASSNNGTFTNADGVYGEIEIDDADSTISVARAVRGLIDSNAGTISNAYQFYGSTTADGTITNNWGIYSQNATKNYLDGTLRLASYGSGSQTGTSAYYLIADSSGNIIEKTPTQVRSDIGAGTGSGTVTSVGITAGTGISVSGSPITGSGSITVTNTAPATIDGSGAATRLAYWSDADTLTSDAGLTYDAGSHLTTTAQVRGGDGVKDTPTYSFDNDRNTGMYREAADDIGFTAGGTTYLKVNGSGVGVASDIYHIGDSDTKIAFTTNEITVTTGGTDAFDVTSGTTRFFTSTRFTSNATFDDDSKAIFGDSGDLEIYHNGSNSIIEDTGTGDLVIKFSNDLLIEGQDGNNLINCNEGSSVQLYHNNSEKLETKSGGIEVTGTITASGDVLDRDIPCVLTSNFSDDSSTTSYLFMPFNNNSESSSNQYYNYFAAPAAGKVVSIMLMHVSGSMSSSFTTQLRVVKNGSTDSTSGELTPSNGTSDGSYVEFTPSSTTFAKGDRLQFSYQKSAGSKYWRGATATIVIELTDYDI